MSITKDFYVCPVSRRAVYEHSTTVNGVQVRAQFSVDRGATEMGAAPPLDYIAVALRRQIEAEVGNLLYKGVR